MHPWRKLFVEWLSSTRMYGLSDGAFRLWVTLITVQDDAGEVLWDRGKILGFIAATTDWNFEMCETLADELEYAGLLTRGDGFVTLYRGAEFNGMLRPERTNSGYFHRSAEQRGANNEAVTVSDSQVTASDGLEERKKRGEKDKKKTKSRGEENASSFDEKTSNSNALFQHLKNACERDLDRVEASLPQKLNDFANQHPDLPAEWVELAFEEAANYRKVSWAYVAAVLEAWLKQGHSGKDQKEGNRGKSRKDSSNDAKRKQPGSGFEPLSGEQARVS